MNKTLAGVFGAALLAGAALVSHQAQAAWWAGNPDLSFRIDRPAGGFVDGDVYVHKVRVHHCDGSYQDRTVNQWVDPIAGHTVRINGGDLCSATWYWDSDFDINGTGFSLRAWPDTTSVNLEAIKPVDLVPYKYGGSPPQPHQEPVLHTTLE
jgi:hypothetical protein